MRLIWLIFLGFTLIAITGCGTTAPQDQPRGSGAPASYRPVPDQELFAAVKSLPGVESSTLRYVNEFGESNAYQGDIRLTSGMHVKRVQKIFEQVAMILRHGHWEGSLNNIQVLSGKEGIGPDSIDLFSVDDYEQRYGPQTGEEGWPPPFVPN